MAVYLDHLMVPSRNKLAAARLMAELLGVPWSETGVGPFVPVFVNDGLTLDFDEWTDPLPMIHYCFRVSEDAFDAILGRIEAAGIPYRSNVHGPVDFQVETEQGGRLVYWNQPDGHQWEMLTVSYARQASPMTYEPINFDAKFGKFFDRWAPRVVAEMNDYQFKLARIQGEFVWHRHGDTDETFIVLQGEMVIEFRDGRVALRAGEMFVVPRGVEHKPVAPAECRILLIEPRGVVNTGDAGGSLTAESDVWV